MPRIPRIIGIFTFIVATLVIGLLLYIVFFQPPTAVEPTGPVVVETPVGGEITAPGGTTVRLPGGPTPVPTGMAPLPTPTPVSSIASGGLTQVTAVTNAPVDQMTLDRDGVSLLYYDPADGRFYRLSRDGKIQPLNDRVFYNVQNVTWSHDRAQAVLEYPDGANIIYNFASNKQITLPKHWEAFDFSPDGSQIVAKSIGLDPGNRLLVLADVAGGNFRPITPLGDNADAVIPAWSANGQMVATLVKNSGADQQELFFIGLNDERFRSTVVPGLGFVGRFTPDGEQLFYSVHNSRSGNRPELWISDAAPDSIGENRRSVGLQTWAHKCAFATAAVAYCAVPQDLPEGAGLFPNEMDNGDDRLYRVDLASASATMVAAPDTRHTMESLTVSSDGRSLYYTAKQDGKVYKIQLK